MFVNIVGNGNGSVQYGGQVIEIADNVTQQEIFDWGDEYRKSASSDLKDQFGDIDTDNVNLEDIANAMPSEWNAKVLDKKSASLFV